MVKRDDVLSLALAIGGPLIGGNIAGLICMKDVAGWYQRIKKPRWTPPNWAFPVVWPLLYVGQGVSSWLVWKQKGKRRLPLSLYGAQLVLNLIWQPIMFKFHRPDIALVDSTAMLGLATAATITMSKAAGDKQHVVAGLMTPYCLWVAFATALTARIWKDNPDAASIDSSVVEPAGSQVRGAVDKTAQTLKAATK